jgi:hypothetical protein
MVKVSMSAMYGECYPFAITDYKEEGQEVVHNHIASPSTTELDLEDQFQLLEKERFTKLQWMFKHTVFKQVVSQIRKVLELECQLELLPGTLSQILRDIVVLAEREPYGVRGGNLVVLFSPSKRSKSGSAPPVKVGTFPLDSGRVATFELHLHLSPSNNVKNKLTNLARRICGQPDKMVIDPKFKLTKKKLYRSMSTS